LEGVIGTHADKVAAKGNAIKEHEEAIRQLVTLLREREESVTVAKGTVDKTMRSRTGC
jgi:hypothetical protein